MTQESAGAGNTQVKLEDPPVDELVLDTVQVLYSGSAQPRDQQIADRITVLHRDALAEDECIRPESLRQFRDFFLQHPDLGLPKITLTPDGTLRARWIHGPEDFVALEFVGGQIAKIVAEIPRDNGVIARHFSTESIRNVLAVVCGIGASFS